MHFGLWQFACPFTSLCMLQSVVMLHMYFVACSLLVFMVLCWYGLHIDCCSPTCCWSYLKFCSQFPQIHVYSFKLTPSLVLVTAYYCTYPLIHVCIPFELCSVFPVHTVPSSLWYMYTCSNWHCPVHIVGIELWHWLCSLHWALGFVFEFYYLSLVVCTTCVAGLLCIHVDSMVVDMPCACSCIWGCWNCCALRPVLVLSAFDLLCCFCSGLLLYLCGLCDCTCIRVGKAVHMCVNIRVYYSHTRLTEFKKLKLLM